MKKKNYNITFYDDDTYSNKNEIDIKWGKMSKYTLKANWIDKTHARNLVSASIYSDIQKKYNLFSDTINNGVVDGFPIEIYVNDEFHGLYTLNLHKNYFFDLDDANPNHLLIAGNANNSITNFRKKSNNWESFELEIGTENQENLDKLNRLIIFVMDSSDEEFVKHFDEYFDFDATLNYYCFFVFGLLIDNGDNNLFLVTYDGQIWYPSMYDMDISWGALDIERRLSYNFNIDDVIHSSLLWQKFERNFGDYIAVRYFDLRDEILNEQYIMNNFYNFSLLIPSSSLLKEENKWGKYSVYDLDDISDFLNKRIPIVDDKIEKLKTDNYDTVYSEFFKDTNDNKIINNNILLFVLISIAIFGTIICYKCLNK